jgi:hypothetical protein
LIASIRMIKNADMNAYKLKSWKKKKTKERKYRENIIYKTY